jgi:hypothetical protein
LAKILKIFTICAAIWIPSCTIMWVIGILFYSYAYNITDYDFGIFDIRSILKLSLIISIFYTAIYSIFLRN